MNKINELYMPMMDQDKSHITRGNASVKSITKAELEKSTKSIVTSNRASVPKLNKIGSNKNSFFVHNGASQKLAS